ncbi:MAG: hypothetical protein ACYCW6_26650, partial [Candidatus Xenobia bacterium]
MNTTDSLWGFIEQLSPRTADVVFAVLAQLCEPSTQDKPKYPLLQPVRITADAILQYKGIQRWGVQRTQMYEWIHDEMHCLQSLRFDMEDVWVRDPKNGQYKGVGWKRDRLFDIGGDVVMFLVGSDRRAATPPARAVDLVIRKNRFGDLG